MYIHKEKMGNTYTQCCFIRNEFTRNSNQLFGTSKKPSFER